MFEPSMEKLEAEAVALYEKASSVFAEKRAALDAVKLAEENAGAEYLESSLEQAAASIKAAMADANAVGKAADAALAVLATKRTQLCARLHERRVADLRGGRDSLAAESQKADAAAAEQRAKALAADERGATLRTQLQRAEAALEAEVHPVRMDPDAGLVHDTADSGVLQAASVDALVAEAAKLVTKRPVPCEAAIRAWCAAVELAVEGDRPILLKGTGELVPDPSAPAPKKWNDVPRRTWVEPNASGPAKVLAVVPFERRYVLRYSCGLIDEVRSQLEFPGAAMRTKATMGLGDPVYTTAGCVSRDARLWERSSK